MKRRIKIIATGALAAILILTLPAMLIGLIWIEIQQDRDSLSAETFRAWKNANPNSTVQYEDWKRLKRHYLLPGQGKPADTVYMPIVTPVYTR